MEGTKLKAKGKRKKESHSKQANRSQPHRKYISIL
jgi:hypothetical protein